MTVTTLLPAGAAMLLTGWLVDRGMRCVVAFMVLAVVRPLTAAGISARNGGFLNRKASRLRVWNLYAICLSDSYVIHAGWSMCDGPQLLHCADQALQPFEQLGDACMADDHLRPACGHGPRDRLRPVPPRGEERMASP